MKRHMFILAIFLTIITGTSCKKIIMEQMESKINATFSSEEVRAMMKENITDADFLAYCDAVTFFGEAEETGIAAFPNIFLFNRYGEQLKTADGSCSGKTINFLSALTKESVVEMIGDEEKIDLDKVLSIIVFDGEKFEYDGSGDYDYFIIANSMANISQQTKPVNRAFNICKHKEDLIIKTIYVNCNMIKE
ncbi:MAG: hypothetical protein PHR20_07090 [Bacteroidales bacterium]|nr:hypothetical protein [Bacteroidales bacterium]